LNAVLRRIVSGGQSGADRAALDVALAAGVEIGGWVPKGRLAEDGVIPDRYIGLREAGSANPAVRTALNVRDSDATLIVSHGALSGGSRLTLDEARRQGRPVLHVDLDDLPPVRAVERVREWLLAVRPSTLNVAGPRASKDPAIAAAVTSLLSALVGEAAPEIRSEPHAERSFATPAPYDFDETLRFTRFGPGDPTARRGDGWFTKAWGSPAGDHGLRLRRSRRGADRRLQPAADRRPRARRRVGRHRRPDAGTAGAVCRPPVPRDPLAVLATRPRRADGERGQALNRESRNLARLQRIT
jgi:hypothetical protein